MLGKVHFEFSYGHIKTHIYSPCESKDGFCFVNFFVATPERFYLFHIIKY
jgi:hypothetical protein